MKATESLAERRAATGSSGVQLSLWMERTFAMDYLSIRISLMPNCDIDIRNVYLALASIMI